MLSSPNTDLAARWNTLRGEKPALRIRDAAATLGVSEAELVALGVGKTATPLNADWRGILNDMQEVGRVMCLTRNEHCVHERHGRFEEMGELAIQFGSLDELNGFIERLRGTGR